MKKLSSHTFFRSSCVPTARKNKAKLDLQTTNMGRVIAAALAFLLLGPALAGQTVIPNYDKAARSLTSWKLISTIFFLSYLLARISFEP